MSRGGRDETVSKNNDARLAKYRREAELSSGLTARIDSRLRSSFLGRLGPRAFGGWALAAGVFATTNRSSIIYGQLSLVEYSTRHRLQRELATDLLRWHRKRDW